MPLSPPDRYKIDEWNQMIDVNIKGVLYGMAAALPYMKEQKAGHIINASSIAGRMERQCGLFCNQVCGKSFIRGIVVDKPS